MWNMCRFALTRIGTVLLKREILPLVSMAQEVTRRVEDLEFYFLAMLE
jgi:hypothetical protein